MPLRDYVTSAFTPCPVAPASSWAQCSTDTEEFAAGRFVAVNNNTADGHNVLMSVDGVNWVIGTLPHSKARWGVTHRPKPAGRIMTIAYPVNTTPLNAGVATRSDDGVAWTAVETPGAQGSGEWRCIAYSPTLDMFLALSNNSSELLRSTDGGVSWTRAATTGVTFNQWLGIAWCPFVGGGLFVGVGNAGVTSNIMTSPDGVNWTARNAGKQGSWFEVCYADTLGLAVAVCSGISVGDNFRISTSPDGINWTQRNTGAVGYRSWRGICWSKQRGLLVACAAGEDAGAPGGLRIMTSPDAATWTSRSITGRQWNSVAWSPRLNLFVAVASDGNEIATSSDGIAWSLVAVPGPNPGNWMHVEWAAIGP